MVMILMKFFRYIVVSGRSSYLSTTFELMQHSFEIYTHNLLALFSSIGLQYFVKASNNLEVFGISLSLFAVIILNSGLTNFITMNLDLK